MAVSIRLQRGGRRNRPYYRIVVADSRKPRDGRFIEVVGTYDPLKKENKITFKPERYNHWLSVGAQPSDKVKYLFKQYKKSNPTDTAEQNA